MGTSINITAKANTTALTWSRDVHATVSIILGVGGSRIQKKTRSAKDMLDRYRRVASECGELHSHDVE